MTEERADYAALPGFSAGPTGRLHESNFNHALAAALRRKRVAWRADGAVISERTDILEGERGKRPDVIIAAPDAAPVSIELEYDNPAIEDARGRLGKYVEGVGQIRSAIAVGVPREVARWPDEQLARRIESIPFSFVVLSSTRVRFAQAPLGDLLPSPDEVTRWPADGYVTGSLDDLACLCEYATAPAGLVARLTNSVADRIHTIADTLHRGGMTEPIRKSISMRLGQHSTVQAIRLACCIWLTALRLQTLLAQRSERLQTAGLLPVDAMMQESSVIGGRRILSASDVREAWQTILSINYKAIFKTARASLDSRIATEASTSALTELARLADDVDAGGLGNRIDFAGELFPRLLDDREEAAAHYTLPQTAELLAALAVERLSLSDWADAAAVSRLRFADMSCGTGSLLRAAYRNVRRRHEAAGGGSEGVHEAMMGGAISGLDVNALATHMTAAGLSSTEIAQEYHNANIGVAPVANGQTGSIEFMEVEELEGVSVPHTSQDLVIQNPPYTRARGAAQGRKRDGRKMFDVSGIGEEERKESMRRLNALRAMRGDGWTHGQAGHGPDFSVLAHHKLKPGGVFASVLPHTAARAESWTGFRKAIEANYDDIVAIAFTIHTSAVESTMMSADTYMNEMLLVATKRPEARPSGEQASIACVNLSEPLHSLTEAYWCAKLIAARDKTAGSGRLYDSGQVGNWTRFTPTVPGGPWQSLGIRNSDLAAASVELLNGRLYAPAEARGWEFSVPFTTLDQLVEIGPTHHLIGHIHGREAIGVFTFYPITPYDRDTPTFPALWAASKKQNRITLNPTHKGAPLADKEEDEIRSMVDKRSDLFIARNLRMTSQALAAARTPGPMMGGRAWAALLSSDDALKATLTLWLNSTLGAIIVTGYGQTTQPGRATMQVNALSAFPVPDFAADTEAGRHARETALGNIDSLSHLELKPLSYAFADGNRKRIDRIVLEMMGLGGNEAAERGLDWLRTEWCKEPATHGGNRDIMEAVGVSPDSGARLLGL